VFLQALLVHNPALVDAAFQLLEGGQIPPNCYVIDLQTVERNAAILSQAARQHQLELYFTTKQVGFNPLVAGRVHRAGIAKAIAIDAWEAHILSLNRIPIGHLGHLVQPPNIMVPALLRLEPDYITVFSLEKAERISQEARQIQHPIRLLLRVIAPGNTFHPGQEGGIQLDELVGTASQIARLPGIRVAGVTSYPCLQVDPERRALIPTQNFYTILQAAEILRSELGLSIEQVNAPGHTCVAAMSLLAEMGATHGEVGHALTGTTYLHAGLDQPELESLVYVSEISHCDEQHAYAFGGGLYRRARARQALVQDEGGQRFLSDLLPFDPTAIDYYLTLQQPAGMRLQVGAKVLIAARAQVFVSRSMVAAVDGIQEGAPQLAGLYDAWGRPVERFW